MTPAARLWAAIRLDIRLQRRSQLYAIGVAVAVLLGLLVRFLIPAAAHGVALAAFYVLAVGGTTFMFSAVMVLRDKSQNTLAALRVSPMDARTYVAAKAITLSGFALVESAIVYVVGGAWSVPLVPLFGGVAMLAVLYTLLGLAQVAPHDSVLRFLMPDAVITSVLLQLPVFYLFEMGPAAPYFAIPSLPALLMMRAAELNFDAATWAYVGIGGGLGWAASAWLALARLRHHVGLI